MILPVHSSSAPESPKNLSKAQFPCSSPVNRYPQDTLTNPVAKFKCRMKSVVILFSNKTRPFDHQPSGNASPPDCFSFHRFTIGKRWGISSPKPLAWGPEPGAPSGRRSLAERRESQGATLVARLCEFPGSVPRPLLRFALIGRFYLRIVSNKDITS